MYKCVLHIPDTHYYTFCSPIKYIALISSVMSSELTRVNIHSKNLKFINVHWNIHVLCMYICHTKHSPRYNYMYMVLKQYVCCTSQPTRGSYMHIYVHMSFSSKSTWKQTKALLKSCGWELSNSGDQKNVYWFVVNLHITSSVLLFNCKLKGLL